MRILSFLTDPPVVDKILKHLELKAPGSQRGPPPETTRNIGSRPDLRQASARRPGELRLDAQVIVGASVIVDGNDVVVGPVIDSDVQDPVGSIVDTILFANGLPVEVRLVGFYQQLRSVGSVAGLSLVFETADCSGQAYITQGNGMVPVNLQVGPGVPVQGATLSIWVPDPLGSSTNVTAIRALNELTGSCSLTTLGAASALPAVEVTTSFVPPYSIAVQPLGVSNVLSVPAVTPLGLCVLVALLIGGGWWILRR
jgi:hypothetical protein